MRCLVSNLLFWYVCMLKIIFFFFFFFSSRRRHTRYIGDWSSDVCSSDLRGTDDREGQRHAPDRGAEPGEAAADRDRKSTRLNSSHRCISYAVFCLKKKKIQADRLL